MMRDNYLDISNLVSSSEIMALFNFVSRHGGVLRFVGGAVRDALKGIKSSDLNLATDMSPEELFEACADEGIQTVPMGIKQGTTGIVIGDKLFEVGSLCKYVLNDDGSVETEFTDNWEEDASRRDLTINAVYADEKGNVFDYYNGIEDLEKGRVHFIGSAAQRIQEDYLRILRYFRFYSLFNIGNPDAKALSACCEHCSGLKKVPMEKIRDELFKIIITPKAPQTYHLMQDNGILAYIMPDALHIDDLAFFNQAIGNHPFEDEALIKMFILYRPDSALAENMSVRLKFSRREKQLFISLAEKKMTMDELLDIKKLKKTAYEYDNDFCRSKILTVAAEERRFPENIWKIYETAASLPRQVFPVKGKDVLAENGGEKQQVGQILKELEQIWVESDFKLSREQLLAHADILKKVI